MKVFITSAYNYHETDNFAVEWLKESASEDPFKVHEDGTTFQGNEATISTMSLSIDDTLLCSLKKKNHLGLIGLNSVLNQGIEYNNRYEHMNLKIGTLHGFKEQKRKWNHS